ncbi:MAG: PqqD family protein [Deltaproteobacteria bacterium]|nr:PqqD family protein [Deltaproteobacteria bacterium]MBW2136915.1 PqqD family protein [Deltaproteobacteria bacterium]
MTTYRKREGILSEKMGKDLVLFDLDTNLPYALNPAAALIFEMMDGERDSREIAQKICQKYDVDLDRAMEDLDTLSQDLVQKGIIERVR